LSRRVDWRSRIETLSNLRTYLDERMKRKTLIILSVALLTAIVSISCSLFTYGTKPTPEPEPCCLVTPSGPLKFEPEGLPSARVGVLYGTEIRITQNSTPASEIFVSNGSLPDGLEFVKVEGEDAATIRGLPKETGTFTFTVTARCYGTMVFGQTGEKEYRLVVEK
jgi:hypothetical protein